MKRDDWDRRYAGQELVWSAGPNRFLVAEASDLKPARALDLACGEGRNAIWLAERGWRVTAVDYSGVAVGKGHARSSEVEFEVADLLVGHDLRNLTEGTGGPKDPQVLYRAEDVPAALAGLQVERAETVDRDGAVDALVRARRPAVGSPR